MDIFWLLSVKLIPLYIYIFLGFIAGKYLNAHQETLSKVMFYAIAPLLIFNGVIETKIDGSLLSLPALTWTISCLLCVGFYRIGKLIWHDGTQNILAFSAGSGNTGYFGLPVAIMLFSEQGEGTYIMAMMGVNLFDNTAGFYATAKGKHSMRECLQKILRLPSLYAFFLALILNFLHIKLPLSFSDYVLQIKGSYTVVGMMILGIGLSSIKTLKLDIKFITLTFVAKFLFWPLMAALVILIDSTFFNFYDLAVYNVLILLSIVPIGVNTAIISFLLNLHPDKASSAVFLSTFFALAYVPLISYLFLN